MEYNILIKIPVNDLKYNPFFCEENIWHLCQEELLDNLERKVVFIFSKNRYVTMKNQRLGTLVRWDYHVVLLIKDTDWMVADFDTRLSFPCSAEEYLNRSFVADDVTFFRMVDSSYYIKNFASDRRHMMGKDGSYLQKPPPWNRIGTGFNLWEFIDGTENKHGEVASLNEMILYCRS